MEITPEARLRLTAYLDVTTPLPDRADLLFVFGTRLLTPAQIAAELYAQHKAPYIVLTGGVNRYTGRNEADAHFALLTSAGIPTRHIIVENQSTNTRENVLFAVPLISQKLPMSSIQSVLAVCKWMHSRRALMTLKRYFPRGIRYYARTYEPEGITRENWHHTVRAESANVLKEWESIPRYLEQGQLEGVVRDGDAYV